MTRWGTSERFSCRVALPLFLLVGCGSSSVGEAGRTPPPGSTETGNPPVIDVTRVALVIMRDEVHVTGSDGAVTPGGAQLEVQTLSSGAVAHGTSDGKGAFDILVQGTIDDTYQLRAFGADTNVMSAPVYLSRGGASVSEGDGGTPVVQGDGGPPIGAGDAGMLSCSQLGSVIDDRITQAADAADRACSTNADCTVGRALNDCPVWPCMGPALSQAGATAVGSTFTAIAGMCQAFTAASCPRVTPDCGDTGPAACVAGTCVDCARGDCSSARCTPCDTAEIIWAPTGPTIGDAHTLIDCKTLVTNFADSSPQCSTEVPCTTPNGSDYWTMGHIQNLLGDPAVKAAFESDALFGPLTPGGFGTNITIDGHTIFMSDPSCANAQNCTEPPLPVQLLFTALDGIALRQSCP